MLYCKWASRARIHSDMPAKKWFSNGKYVCVCVCVILSAHKSIIPIVVVAHIGCESFLVVALLLMLKRAMLRRYRRVIRDSFISAWSLWYAMINFYCTVTIDSDEYFYVFRDVWFITISTKENFIAIPLHKWINSKSIHNVVKESWLVVFIGNGLILFETFGVNTIWLGTLYLRITVDEFYVPQIHFLVLYTKFGITTCNACFNSANMLWTSYVLMWK